jgi:uncharacterized membrane protein YgcG
MPSRNRMDIPYRGGPPPGSHYARERDYDDRSHPPHGYHDGRRRSIDAPHGHHRPRDPYGPPSRRDSGVPFETALKNLLDTLEDARGLFGAFDRNFMEETRYIKAYANSEILDNLWACKIEFSHRPTRNRRPRYSSDAAYQEESRDNVEDNSGDFLEYLEELKENFSAAIHSKQRSSHSRRDRPQPSGSESLSRLIDKLKIHSKFLNNIMGNIRHRRDDQEMRDFATELDQACDILKKSRKSWDPREGNADREGEGGGYGDGHGSDGGGGGDGYQDG